MTRILHIENTCFDLNKPWCSGTAFLLEVEVSHMEKGGKMAEAVANLRLIAGLLFWLLADMGLILIWVAVLLLIGAAIIKWGTE